MTTKARTRYAPSPTGRPHIGNLRTAIYSYLLAKHTGGQFVLRIEDTDRKRFSEEALDAIKESLKWLGLDWDEGPEKEGPYGPYFQSERLDIYTKYAEELIAKGKAYKAYDRERTEEERKAAEKNPQLSLAYSRQWRDASDKQRREAEEQGIKPVIRFKIPLEGTTRVPDIIVKPPVVHNNTLPDHVLLKSDGFPTYHLAAMVDDHLMAITHILRGQEWLPTAPLHVMIYEAFGWEMPILVHPPVILNPPGQKGKLSKRENAVYVLQYRELGYLPEALLNYLVLLGWSYDDHTEIFSKQDLIEKFDVTRIQPTPAKFSLEKLEWFNGYYINHILTAEDFAARCLPFLVEAGLISLEEAEKPGPRMDTISRFVNLVKDKVKLLSEVPGEIDFMFNSASQLDYPAGDLIRKKETRETAMNSLETAIAFLEKLPDSSFHTKNIAEGLTTAAQEAGLGTGTLFWPVRVALCGRKNSPDASAMIEAYGREATIEHLRLAYQKLEKEQL